MITEMSKEEVIAIGSRNRAGYLVEQSGYTIGLARLDGAALDELLPPVYIDEVMAVEEAVRATLKDRTVAGEESKSSTQLVNEVIRETKVWRRAVAARAKRAVKMGKKIPDTLLVSEGMKGIPGISTQMDKMIKLLETNSENLPGANLKALIDKGKKLAESIKEIDAAQEIKRLKKLPDKIREFYYQKGLLFIGLKVINEAGRELHANNPSAAAKFNFTILYRSSGKKKSSAKKKEE